MRQVSIIVALFFTAGAATHAAVNVSTQPTQNMSCSAGVCTPIAQKAYLNVNDLTAMLAAGDLQVKSANGAQDIHIEAPFSWTSANRLTLDAQRSIEVEKPVVVAGKGALTLTTNDGGTGGDYSFDPKASVTFWDVHSRLVINGQRIKLEKNIATLAADVAANPGGAFALARDYDASQDGTYSAAPVAIALEGIFEGLGNTLSRLSIVDTTTGDNVGLFASIGKEGVIRDVRLAHMHVSGGESAYIGALVGTNGYGTLVHDEVGGGDVIAEGSNVLSLGGLVGQNGLRTSGSAIISQSSTSATVSAASDALINVLAGGLAGENFGTITQSSARGDVRQADMAGGLVGDNSGLIDTSYATGAITDLRPGVCLGGLVAFHSGTIAGSHATGAVTAGDDAVAGGLACDTLNSGQIIRSFASGSVTIGNRAEYDVAAAGGLVGSAGCSGRAYIRTSFATGAVVAGSGTRVGGLEGLECSTTTQNSYATGAVMALQKSWVGGLVGHKSNGTFDRTYSAGRVSGGQASAVGGLIGFDHFSARERIQFAYWDVDASGTTTACGNDYCSGTRGLTTSQFQSGLPAGFDPTVWGQNPNINNGYPYLLANPPQ